MKNRAYMTLNEMIQDAGWFPGSEKDWQALSREERSGLSFAATGCLTAYPTWKDVHCVHVDCRVKRGEVKPICITNHYLIAEKYNWLRFILDTPEGRSKVARIFRNARCKARETAEYNPWNGGGWAGFVYGGLDL